jgi:hypothetical protein
VTFIHDPLMPIALVSSETVHLTAHRLSSYLSNGGTIKLARLKFGGESDLNGVLLELSF